MRDVLREKKKKIRRGIYQCNRYALLGALPNAVVKTIGSILGRVPSLVVRETC